MKRCYLCATHLSVERTTCSVSGSPNAHAIARPTRKIVLDHHLRPDNLTKSVASFGANPKVKYPRHPIRRNEHANLLDRSDRQRSKRRLLLRARPQRVTPLSCRGVAALLRETRTLRGGSFMTRVGGASVSICGGAAGRLHVKSSIHYRAASTTSSARACLIGGTVFLAVGRHRKPGPAPGRRPHRVRPCTEKTAK
jgi:hypothetical protein